MVPIFDAGGPVTLVDFKTALYRKFTDMNKRPKLILPSVLEAKAFVNHEDGCFSVAIYVVPSQVVLAVVPIRSLESPQYQGSSSIVFEFCHSGRQNHIIFDVCFLPNGPLASEASNEDLFVNAVLDVPV